MLKLALDDPQISEASGIGFEIRPFANAQLCGKQPPDDIDDPPAQLLPPPLQGQVCPSERPRAPLRCPKSPFSGWAGG